MATSIYLLSARLTRWLGYNNFSTTLTTNPEAGSVYHAMSNTYYYDGVNTSGHGSYLGASYSEYNLLQLIHNKKNTERFGTDSLFGYSSTFSMTSHNSQFVGDKIMNDGNALGWEFRVEAIDSSRAAVKVTKS